MSQAWLICSRYVDQSSKFTDVYLQTIFFFSVTVTQTVSSDDGLEELRRFFHLKLCLKNKAGFNFVQSVTSSPCVLFWMSFNKWIYIYPFSWFSLPFFCVWERKRDGNIKLVSVHRFFDPTAYPVIWKGPTKACKTHKRFVNKPISRTKAVTWSLMALALKVRYI